MSVRHTAHLSHEIEVRRCGHITSVRRLFSRVSGRHWARRWPLLALCCFSGLWWIRFLGKERDGLCRWRIRLRFTWDWGVKYTRSCSNEYQLADLLTKILVSRTTALTSFQSSKAKPMSTDCLNRFICNSMIQIQSSWAIVRGFGEGDITAFPVVSEVWGKFCSADFCSQIFYVWVNEPTWKRAGVYPSSGICRLLSKSVSFSSGVSKSSII